MKKLLKLFASYKIALLTMSLLALFFILSTFIPQIDAGSASLVAESLSFFSSIFTIIGLDHFFSSALFYFLFSIFIINLSACTILRLLTQIKKKKNRRFGPDILHIGLLLLCAAGLISSIYRENYFVWLYKNARVKTPNDFILTLNDYKEEYYKDNRIKDYISIVTVEKNNTIVKDKYLLTVNNPLKIGEFELFQTSSRTNTQLVLSRNKEETTLTNGNKFIINNIEYVFMGVQKSETSTAAAFTINSEKILLPLQTSYTDKNQKEIFFVKELIEVKESGLSIIKDPGISLMYVGFFVVMLGLIVIVVYKLKEIQI